MELKPYQQQVIADLRSFLDSIQVHKDIRKAFDTYTEEKWGLYNPLDGTGMPSYKHTIPHAANVCIKVPTAGGKTFIAVNALRTIFDAFDTLHPKAVVWLVPWSNLLDQTVNNLSNPDHPYRQKLNALFNHRVQVYEKKDLLQGSNFNPTVVSEQLTIVVMSFSSLRSKKKEDRKVYQENGQLATFAAQYKDDSHLLPDTDETALINVIRSLNPVVVVDESHNAESELSVDMLKNLNPSFVLDLTATPKNNSNIVSLVPAISLKKEHMVKLPVIVYNHPDKTEVISSALHLRQKLEALAIEQRKAGGKYIRPIVLFQAQPRTSEDNTTFDKLKAQLVSLGIPEEQIKIKTAEKDELKGIDLMSETCPVRYIITINALKEGWDCPFAYILASLADKSSAVDVEQILGRVLRQPYVMKHAHALLNISYVLTASAKFHDTLQNIVKGLQASGFSDKDYRKQDVMPESVKTQVIQKPLENFLFPEQTEAEPYEEEIDSNRIQFAPDEVHDSTSPGLHSVHEIEKMATEETILLDQEIQKLKEDYSDLPLLADMGEKIKTAQIREAFLENVSTLQLPQFHLKVTANALFGFGEQVLLNQESLLKDFKLSKYDTLIDFEQIQSDLYKVDIQEAKKNEYTPSFMKIEDLQIKDPLVDYILARPKEKQIQEIAYQLMGTIGNLYPIPEQEIKLYLQRILEGMTQEQLRDILVRRLSYSDRIKAKIKLHADKYAEEQFEKQVTVGKIETLPSWKFPERLIPGKPGPSIAKSLYDTEGAMNGFEIRVISEIAGMPNVRFWHRNQVKGRGFSINGFKSNHYPDFIIYTESGKVIVLETKGDDRDNSDSEAKCRLGKKWAELAGKKFIYMMVFDQREVAGAYSFDQAKGLIREM
ncbi:type III restriction enzyme [Algoriphagus boseongensis]|uniref:Type III restriction enzyme n=1 Tax=Algoriphagus boseongensis TaxID=1442587 RepID=A0A4V3D241_9BACT|nr:DEAD/DEAH box helicase family protein [Algoriphagus boseongensis]TDQ16900.1 type III restriction enzyme [Algoriphagus boseongensis]